MDTKSDERPPGNVLLQVASYTLQVTCRRLGLACNFQPAICN
jgi:hypothetical protein